MRALRFNNSLPVKLTPVAPSVIQDPLDDEDLLDNGRTILEVCGLNPNIDRFITCHGITILDNFEFIDYMET